MNGDHPQGERKRTSKGMGNSWSKAFIKARIEPGWVDDFSRHGNVGSRGSSLRLGRDLMEAKKNSRSSPFGDIHLERTLYSAFTDR